jgi:hypothetical protein
MRLLSPDCSPCPTDAQDDDRPRDVPGPIVAVCTKARPRVWCARGRQTHCGRSSPGSAPRRSGMIPAGRRARERAITAPGKGAERRYGPLLVQGLHSALRLGAPSGRSRRRVAHECSSAMMAWRTPPFRESSHICRNAAGGTIARSAGEVKRAQAAVSHVHYR